MSRLPADHPWVTVRRPDGERWMSVRPPVGFFHQLHPKFPRVAERRPACNWAECRGTPANELICVTSANHPAKFNCELKCLGRRRMSKDEHFRSACSGGGRPIFAGFDAKVTRSDDRFFSIGTAPLKPSPTSYTCIFRYSPCNNTFMQHKCHQCSSIHCNYQTHL